MTLFERRGLAVIGRTLLQDLSPGREKGGFAVRVQEEGGYRVSAYWVNKISFTDVDIQDQTTYQKIYSMQPDYPRTIKLGNEERQHNIITLEEITSSYIKGRDSYYRFEIRATSYSSVEVKDDEIGMTVHYKLS